MFSKTNEKPLHVFLFVWHVGGVGFSFGGKKGEVKKPVVVHTQGWGQPQGYGWGWKPQHHGWGSYHHDHERTLLPTNPHHESESESEESSKGRSIEVFDEEVESPGSEPSSFEEPLQPVEPIYRSYYEDETQEPIYYDDNNYEDNYFPYYQL